MTPLVQFIQAAHHSLDGEVYELTSKPVEAALEAAAHRGVVVRIALEPHPKGASRTIPQNAYKTLAAQGVHVEWTSSAFTFTHAKYLVADATSAWIGSPNWIAAAFKSNREFSIVDTDPTVVGEAESVFQADWAHQTFTGNASALVLSPTNSRSQITARTTGAHSTLDVYAEELDDPAQEDALIAAVHRGVRVRIVCTGDGDVANLRAGGVQVVVDKKLYIHAKAIVADGTTVFIGSENISATSFDKNREMGLILTDRAVVATVEKAFASDFGGAPSPVSPPAATPVVTPTQTAPSSDPSFFRVLVSVSPNPMQFGSKAVVTAKTTPGAKCTSFLIYSTVAEPSSFYGGAETVPASGSVSWSWHEESKGSGGTVTVTCSFQGRTASATAAFTVTH